MGLRLRRGGISGPGTPAVPVYGPVKGAQWVRAATAPQAVICWEGTPNVDYTQLNPQNSQATNQAAITADTTGKVWWPKGTYGCSTGFTLKSGTEYRLEGAVFSSWPSGSRSATDSAVINGPGYANGSVRAFDGSGFTVKGGKVQNWPYGLACENNVTYQDVEVTAIYGNTTAGNSPSINVYGDNNIVRRCYVHDNGSMTGVQISQTTTQYGNLIEYCRLYNNNLHQLGVGTGAAGMKALHEHDMTARSNWAHGNYGVGLWWDTDCSNLLIEENVCEDNYVDGIFLEVVGGGSICRRNVIVGNVTSGNPYWTATNLQISSCDARQFSGSDNVLLVTRNVIDVGTRTQAIAVDILADSGHSGNVPYGNHIIDNDIWLRGTSSYGGTTSKVGGAASPTAYDIFTNRAAQDLVWQDNIYHVPNLTIGKWCWRYTPSADPDGLTWAEWQALGFDTTGTRVLL